MQWKGEAEGGADRAGGIEAEGGIDLAGEEPADGEAEARAAGAAAATGFEEMGAKCIRNSVTFVGHKDRHAIGTVAEHHVNGPSRRRSVDGVVDEIVDDQAEQAAAMAIDGVVEAAGDFEGDVVLSSDGEIATTNEVDEFVVGEFVGGGGGVVAKESDSVLDHRLHAFGVVGGGLPIGRGRIFTTGYNGAEAGDGALKTVDEV